MRILLPAAHRYWPLGVENHPALGVVAETFPGQAARQVQEAEEQTDRDDL
jgi:hypothetical protein